MASSDNTSGWHPDQGQPQQDGTSWLRQHGRIAIVIVLGSLAFIVVSWYIVRSIKGMRKRLREENEKQMQMIQQIVSGRTGGALAPPPHLGSTNGNGHPPNPTATQPPPPPQERY